MVVNKAPIFINYGLRYGRQDGIVHVNYAGITLFHLVVDRIYLYELLRLGLEKNDYSIWGGHPIPQLGIPS